MRLHIGQKKGPDFSGPDNRLAATYSPACYRSTIGATGLNFSVRNGKRWDTGALAAIVSSISLTV